ncbi:MAG TPA: hypothetical protein VF111_10250 [Thermoanaerobaculia bacterium]
MRARVVLLFAILLGAYTAPAAEVVRVGRWELHSSFWMGLHQTLMHDASTRTPRDLAALTAEQKSAWDAAVALYRTTAGRGSITFAQPMMNLQNDLTQVADDAVELTLTGPLTDALRQVAPVYRSHWWESDDAANRFFIGYAAAMLRDAGEEIAAGHERLYRQRMPKAIRVDLAPYGGTFGAYAHSLRHGFTVTISSRDPGYTGLAALESVLHESSHSIVSPFHGTLAAAIEASSKKRGIEPPRDLWHAILFATTSELTRRALAARGAASYVPFSADLLTRAWPQYRVPIETHWLPYMNGQGTLEEAVEKVVGMVKEAVGR